MKKLLSLISSLALATMVNGQSSMVNEKQIYIPRDLRNIDLSDTTAKWNWRNTVQTPDLVFFWEQPFGADPAKAPSLDGHKMTFDLDNLRQRVQGFYNYFRDTLRFTLPGSLADSLKMMVMVNYSLEGTAYGGTYDNHIGALWVSPNRIQDKHLNCLAHELGHSFQLQVIADGAGEAWGGSGFYEMTSQWMLWRVNPDWPTEENYHLAAFRDATHKAFLAPENIYRSPYVIEYWAERRGLDHIARLYREGRRSEDPAMTYMRVNHLTQRQFNDELFDCYKRLLNFDFDHAYEQTRRHACTFRTRLDTISDGHYRIPADLRPEQYGFNAICLPKDTPAEAVRVTNVKAPRGHHLRWTIVDEPECRYLLVMNEPRRHTRMATRGHKQAPLPVISYDIVVKK